MELEKLELEKAKLRLQEEDRRAVKRPTSYRRDDSYEDRKRPVSERHFEQAPPPPRFDTTSTTKSIDSDKKYSSSSKDYKSRIPYDKHDSYSKRERDYDTSRSHQSSMVRPPPTAISKYENSNVFDLSRDRDVRGDPRGRDGSSSGAVAGSRMAKDTRYSDRDRERSPHFRSVRDDRERRSVPEHKSSSDVRSRDHRYTDTSKGNIFIKCYC